jgi:hypothetical protein
VTFDENKKLHELQINTDLPGLQLEGEQVIDNDLLNPVTPETPERREPELETQTISVAEPMSHTYPPRSTQRLILIIEH